MKSVFFLMISIFIMIAATESGVAEVAQKISPNSNPGADIASGFRSFFREDWRPVRDYAMLKVTDPKRDGNYSARIELKSGDCGKQPGAGWDDCAHGNERVEFISNDRQKDGDDFEYGWSVYVDPSFPRQFGRDKLGRKCFLDNFMGTTGGVRFLHSFMEDGSLSEVA